MQRQDELAKYKHLLELIATRPRIPSLHHIFQISYKEGWSVDKLTEKILEAINGTYHPKSYSDYEKDLAVLVYELGGGAALYALNHSDLSLPSRFTIGPIRREFSLKVSKAGIRMTDLLENIRICFENYAPNVGKCGVNLSQDEISCGEGRVRWDPNTDQVLGLCEHASDLGSLKLGGDLKVLNKIVEAVRVTKDVHIGHEASVATFSLYDDKYYGARPALIMPTCKKGDWIEAACQNAMLLAAWKYSPFGAALHGDVWSLGSDGDPKRRPALYLVTMVRKVQPEDALFRWLGNLPGLNLLCGQNFETPSFDPKHSFKREFFKSISIEAFLYTFII